jgi:hypothetical protein
MTTNTDDKQQRPPLALLRYPGTQAGESAYAVIRPSSGCMRLPVAGLMVKRRGWRS